MPTCFLVFGQPRSGTSLTAGLVHHHGINMGEMFAPAEEMNPKGFFEDQEFDYLMQECFSVDDLPKNGQELPATIQEQVKRLIDIRESRGFDWGVKLLFGAAILPLLLGNCEDVKLVRTIRDPRLSRMSLARHTDHSYSKIAKLIQWSIDAGDWAESMMPSHRVEFDGMIDNPESELLKLSGFIGREFRSDILKFIDPSLRSF